MRMMFLKMQNINLFLTNKSRSSEEIKKNNINRGHWNSILNNIPEYLMWFYYHIFFVHDIKMDCSF